MPFESLLSTRFSGVAIRALLNEFHRFSPMWSGADVLGLFSNNVVSFSRNVVLSGHLF
jgi:hypothetical protein